PALDPVVYCLIVSALALLAFGWTMVALGRADGMGRIERLLFAGLPALTGNFVWLAFTGMEPLILCVLSVLTIHLWFRSAESGPGRRSAVAAGVALGALSMTRPEGAALALLLLASVRWARRSLADTLTTLGVAGVGVVVPVIVNLITVGTPLPTT